MIERVDIEGSKSNVALNKHKKQFFIFSKISKRAGGVNNLEDWWFPGNSICKGSPLPPLVCRWGLYSMLYQSIFPTPVDVPPITLEKNKYISPYAERIEKKAWDLRFCGDPRRKKNEMAYEMQKYRNLRTIQGAYNACTNRNARDLRFLSVLSSIITNIRLLKSNLYSTSFFRFIF